MIEKRKKHPVGTLKISKNVVTTIAHAAALEVDGVSRLSASQVDIKGMIAKRQIPKPVSVTIVDGLVEIELHLFLKNDVKIPNVSESVQRSVKEAVQNMTDITVSNVNLIIEGIDFDQAIEYA